MAGLMILLFAVPAASSEFQFSLAFSPSLPQGEFHDDLGRTIWGGSIGFGFRPSRSPVLIGMSLGFGVYGTEHRESWLGLTDPDLLVDVRTTNAVLAWNLFLRLQPEAGFLRPYLDLFSGVHILTTDTRIGEDEDDDFGVNNSSDAVFAFGAGAGLQLPILRFVQQDGRRIFSIDLDLGVRYARGGRADYLVESGEPGIFDTRTSRTDLLALTAGLSFIF
jgi:hypothetical protein